MNLESRRQFLKRASTVALMSGAVGAPGAASPARREKAQIAITLDLEMSRNFPEWENTEWIIKREISMTPRSNTRSMFAGG